MIEVLIALVILAVGLLGLALLQTMNLRYTKSAEQRTLAVNLANELLDTMRSNRSEIGVYAIGEGGFDAVPAVPGTGCAMYDILTSANNLARWQCQVRETLGPQATAVVDVSLAPQVTVIVSWDESRLAELDGKGEVTLVTQL